VSRTSTDIVVIILSNYPLAEVYPEPVIQAMLKVRFEEIKL